MKEGISGTALFNIVIVFVLLFTGYICISINRSKAYNVKNELVNIIKNQGGVCTGDEGLCYNFKEQISTYFNDVTYHSKGRCKNGWVGYDRNGELITDSRDYAAFCVQGINALNGEIPNAIYYQVELFYQLDLPVFRSLFNFSVFGETPIVYNSNECNNPAVDYHWCG